MTSSPTEQTLPTRGGPPAPPDVSALAETLTLCGHIAPGDRRRCRQLPPRSQHGAAAGGIQVHTDGEVFWTHHRDLLYADAQLTSLADEAAFRDRVATAAEELDRARSKLDEIDEGKIDPDPFPGYGSVGVRRDVDFPIPESGLKDSGQRVSHGTTGAVRERLAGKGRFDLISPFVLARLARHMEAGAIKYDDGRNWEKGLPLSWYYDATIRHLGQYLAGEQDEDHLAAALWNVHGLMHTAEMIDRGVLPGELDDLPHYLNPKES